MKSGEKIFGEAAKQAERAENNFGDDREGQISAVMPASIE